MLIIWSILFIWILNSPDRKPVLDHFFLFEFLAQTENRCSIDKYILCDDNADCTDNVDGSFTCTCKPDYQGDGLKGDNHTGCRLGNTRTPVICTYAAYIWPYNVPVELHCCSKNWHLFCWIWCNGNIFCIIVILLSIVWLSQVIVLSHFNEFW